MSKKLLEELLTKVENVSAEVEAWAKAEIVKFEAEEKKLELIVEVKTSEAGNETTAG